MEEWFQKNIDHPYATRETKMQLSKKTNLNLTQISNWMLYRRKKFKKKYHKTSITLENKVIMTDFFKSNQKPKCEEIFKLKQSTGLSKKKILDWFAYMRFKNKK